MNQFYNKEPVLSREEIVKVLCESCSSCEKLDGSCALVNSQAEAIMHLQNTKL